MWTIGVPEGLAALALARGRPHEARAILAEHVSDDTAPRGYAVFLLPRFAVGLRAEAELATQARARSDAEGERDATARAGQLVARARHLFERAWEAVAAPLDAVLNLELCELEAARSRGEAGADDWAHHVARCNEIGRPYGAAYARLRESEAALRQGLPRARIAETLREASATARRLGARPLLDELEELARRARVTLSDEDAELEAPGAAAGLTDRELDVLRLVAEGRTNPEIGQTLYMSPKTASVHVSRILAKLGVRSRTEAVVAAHRLGLISEPSPG